MSGASVRPISTGGTPACLSGRYLALDAKTYAITVQTSMVPITTDELPDAKLFQEYPLYVTRAKEDGQTRYRLRLGTFENLAKAEALMPALRLTFPAAWANELSTDERQSSSAVRHWRGNTILPRAESNPDHEAPPSNVTRVRPAVTKRAPSVEPAIEQIEQPPAPQEELARPAQAVTPIRPRPQSSKRIEQIKSRLAGDAEEIEHEIDLDEPPAPESLITKGLQRHSTKEKQAKDRALQQRLMDSAEVGTQLKAGDGICAFALNLGWSQQPLNRENIPELVIFDKHYLYAVRTVHDSEIWYGLRLGFFPTRQRAEQLTYLLSKHFESVLVIPVRSEEFLASAELAVPSLNDREDDGPVPEDSSEDGTAVAERSSEPAALIARPGITQGIIGNDSETESLTKPKRQSSVSRIVAVALRPLVLLTVLLTLLAGAVLYQILYYT